MSNLNRDFIYKLVTNFVRLPVSFAIQALSVRLLGPSAYGNYEFLTSFSNKIVSFFETGTSTAFYTKLSKEKEDYRLIRFYWFIVCGIVILYLLLFFTLYVLNLYQLLWTGQTSYLVLLSIFWGIFTFLGKTILKIIDAQNLTSKGEIARVIHQVVALGFIVSLFAMYDSIRLELFFYFQLIIAFLLIVFQVFVLSKNNIPFFPKTRLNKEYLSHCKTWFWSYSNPLLVYSLVGLLVGLGERWLLQRFGGAVEQGYFGLSFRVGAFIFLFTSAAVPLLIREFSKSIADGNLQRTRMLFTRNSKALYFLASLLAVYVYFNSEFVTSLFGGEEFKEAGFVVSLMAFYPVHQTYGQLNGSLFYSSERTAEYRNVGLVLMPIGLACSFFLIAPEKYLGLSLGAEGLAYQMIGIQIITVNVLLYSNSKFLNVSYMGFLINQILVIAFLLGIGWIVSHLFAWMEHILYQSLLELVVYGLLSIVLVWFYPDLIGFQKADLVELTSQIENKFRRK